MNPTTAELEILQIIWVNGPSTVRLVHEELSRTKKVFYTTVLKTMQIMFEKRILDRDTTARAHIYSSLVSENNIKKGLVGRLKDSVFGGSTEQLIISALGGDKPDRAELAALKSLIDKLEQDDD